GLPMPDSSCPRMILEFAGATDIGEMRENNEDSWWAGAPVEAIETFPTEAAGSLPIERGVLLAVADGLGGASAGEVASHLALQEVVAKVAGMPRGKASPAKAREVLLAANTRVVQESLRNEAWLGMGATMSFLWVEQES